MLVVRDNIAVVRKGEAGATAELSQIRRSEMPHDATVKEN